MLKYGIHKYPNLIDSNGEKAFGLDDSVLQDRKLRYFYFYVSRHNVGIGDDDGMKLDKRLFNSNLEMKKYLKDLNLWKSNPSTKMRVTMAILEKIKENPELINSKEFETVLLNPKNVANFMNVSREKFHDTSISASKKREQMYGLGIRDIDMVKSASRDSNTAINKRAFYDSRYGKGKNQ
jgi:hypothetical protein